MKKKEESLQAILNQGLLPLFFYEDANRSLEIIRTLYKAGIRVLEYTNRGQEALENFSYLSGVVKKEMQDLHLGIGTIRNTAQAADFIEAGADFIVCPVVDPAVGELVHQTGLLWIPGCLTPTEINIANRHQAALIKIFPANILGPSYISAVKELFPGQLFMPTGGVEIDSENIGNWFASGVCAVGMGSKLISKKILESGDCDTLLSLTQKAMEIVKEKR